MFPLQQWLRGAADFLQGTPHYVSSTASPPQQGLPRDGYESEDDGPTITSCVGGRGAPSSTAQTAVAEREPLLSRNAVAERQPLLSMSSSSVSRPEPQPEPVNIQSLLEGQLDRVTYIRPPSGPPPGRSPPEVEWSPPAAPTSVRNGAVELSQNLTSPFVLSESDVRSEPSVHIRSSGEDWQVMESRLHAEAGLDTTGVVVEQRRHPQRPRLGPSPSKLCREFRGVVRQHCWPRVDFSLVVHVHQAEPQASHLLRGYDVQPPSGNSCRTQELHVRLEPFLTHGFTTTGSFFMVCGFRHLHDL